MNKDLRLSSTEINKLIDNLSILSNDLDNISRNIAKETATIGLAYLQNQYASRNFDENISDIKTNILNNGDNFKIIASGKDVVYEEFGTGDKGQQSPHPDKNKYNLNDYNSGSFILDVQDVKNGEMLDVLANNSITSGKFWSYRKNGQRYLTQGVPAGMEMFNTSKYLKKDVIKKVAKEKVSDALSKV